MSEFEQALTGLNERQRDAVTAIEGPVLVIAGPGTGKTQLIGTRIGYILQKTDTLPQNILCLTFTEAGAGAMRERLIQLLGQTAYDVQISTYHAFGSEILRKHPEYLNDVEMEPIDEVGRVEILQDILEQLPYSNPLKFSTPYLGDLIGFIGDCKKALLSPKDVKQTASKNLEFIDKVNKDCNPVLSELVTISKKSIPIFEGLFKKLQAHAADERVSKQVLPMAHYAIETLKQALDECASTNKTTALTAWKNKWLAKDENGTFIFDGKRINQRILAAAEIYDKYQDQLIARRLFDFDDMILRAIHALETNADFKYTLAENYQFIMLDEFQDTNPAQMHLIELLTDHPVNEGRPNILAVGDDDQAIYAFQGADHANMAHFASLYRDVKIISLEDNYRSHPEILTVAQSISGQIKERLHHNFSGISKTLTAANKKLPAKAQIVAAELESDLAQYAWIAEEIKRLITKEGIEPSEIAILAPKHKYLLPVLPYLSRQNIAVRYEKRENILDEPLVRQLEQMSRLVLALNDNDNDLADSLWPEILSYEFWGLSTSAIWNISWSANLHREPWTKTLMENKSTRPIALFFLKVKDLLPTTSLEQQLDLLIGVPQTFKDLRLSRHNPFFDYYFGDRARKNSLEFMSLLSSLSVLRSRVRRWKRDELKPLSLKDFLSFIDSYRTAGLNILNTSPYNESDSAVNVMTAYAAKGREFQAVFVIDCHDDVWGNASRSQSSRLSLPANMQFIRYQGTSEDERLRLFFVAITRAKTHLYLTGYVKTLDGQSKTKLKYLSDESSGLEVLPQDLQLDLKNSGKSTGMEALEDYWATRHRPPFNPSLRGLLHARLAQYTLSATHLNEFTDIANDGPQDFFVNRILRFPSARTPSAVYGNAVHETLRFLGQSLNQGKKLASCAQALKYFERKLAAERLAANDFELLLERGKNALATWYEQKSASFRSKDVYEHNFQGENIVLEKARLSGKVDRIILDTKKHTATIVDFKTGQPHKVWDKSDVRLHRYRQQLLMYKLLIENSKAFSDYKVIAGVLEFVEPNEDGQIIQLELEYDKEELEELKQLILAMWQCVLTMKLPDVSKYPKTISGIRAFENDLRASR